MNDLISRKEAKRALNIALGDVSYGVLRVEMLMDKVPTCKIIEDCVCSLDESCEHSREIEAKIKKALVSIDDEIKLTNDNARTCFHLGYTSLYLVLISQKHGLEQAKSILEKVI